MVEINLDLWKLRLSMAGTIAVIIGVSSLGFAMILGLMGRITSNLAGIQLLKEYVASELGVEDGELIALSKGLHLYDYTWELARTAAGLDAA